MCQWHSGVEPPWQEGTSEQAKGVRDVTGSGGSKSLGAALAESRVGGFLALRILSPACGPFTWESGSISYGVM
jgi:hypothetical protein